jgi:hypothetical protein
MKMENFCAIVEKCFLILSLKGAIMEEEKKHSRRSFVKKCLFVCLVVLTGLHVFFRTRKKHTTGVQELIGTPFVIPVASVRDMEIFRVVLSSDGTQICVVHGNITTKFISVADFPVVNSKRYRKIAEISNCYKVDGLSWSPYDKNLIACKLTKINVGEVLPDVLSETEWRALGERRVFSEKDIYGEFAVIHCDSGVVDSICKLPPSLKESKTASTTWGSSDYVYCNDEDCVTQIYLIPPFNTKVVLDWSQDKNKDSVGAICDIAVNRVTDECLVVARIQSKMCIFYIDKNGEVTERTTPTDKFVSLGEFFSSYFNFGATHLVSLYRKKYIEGTIPRIDNAMFIKNSDGTEKTVELSPNVTVILIDTSSSNVVLYAYARDTDDRWNYLDFRFMRVQDK